MAFPGYPPPGGPAADPLWGYFSAVAGRDGQIDAEELQRCLSSGFPQKGFTKETCRIMIAMLDVSHMLHTLRDVVVCARDYSGKMGFNEFKELWTVISQWHQTFVTFDQDRSGNIDPREMNQALTAFGYRLSPQAFNVLMGRYSVNGQVAFDDFIACCIKLRTLTDQFRARDVARNGTATFQYDDFIQVAMKL